MDARRDQSHVLDAPELIARASAAGYTVSPRMLETFRAAALIPRPDRSGHRGRSPLWEYPPGTDQQLATLLRHRETTTNLHFLRVLLWVDGFPIPIDAVRASITQSLQVVRSELDRVLATFRQRDGIEGIDEAISQVAGTLAARRGPRALPRYRRVRAEERARSLELVIRVFGLGETVEATEDDANLVERTMGLAPNGRKHLVNGAGPWLTGPATALFDAANVVALPRMIQSIADATDAELEAARTAAVALWHGLPLVIRMMTIMFDDENFAGMGTMTHLGQEPLHLVMIVAAVVGMLRTNMADNVKTMVEALQAIPDLSSEMQQVLDLPASAVQERMATQPPEAQQRLKRMIDAALEQQTTTRGPLA